MTSPEIYEREYVAALFDEMAGTYNLVNSISSFGFCHRWRRQCAAQVSFKQADHVLDLMCGMGEMVWHIDQHLTGGSVIGIDYSPVMCQHAMAHRDRWTNHVAIQEADALESHLDDKSMDVIVSCFGLKTMSDDQLRQLADEVFRLLRPGIGRFSFLEISVPKSKILRYPFMFYLHRLVPFLGKLMLGNPDNYRMLGLYTEAFGDCEAASKHFRAAGLETHQVSYFFGCATGLVGIRPKA